MFFVNLADVVEEFWLVIALDETNLRLIFYLMIVVRSLSLTIEPHHLWLILDHIFSIFQEQIATKQLSQPPEAIIFILLELIPLVPVH